MNKKILFILIFIFLTIITTVVYCSTYPLNKGAEFNIGTGKLKEKDYVNAYCKGIKEYRLDDGTRVDCLTDEYAIEFDRAHKWAESIGQSLYYAKKTNKKPAVALIIKSAKDLKYAKRINTVDKNIKVFIINSNTFQ